MLGLKEWIAKMSKTVLVGEIKPYAGSNEPAGWLKCDGRAISRTDYSALFNVIGTTYGTGDGSTTFNLPDLRDRFPVGAGDTYDAGDTGGEAEVTLTTNQMPSHNHTPDTNANFVTVDKGRNLGMTAKRSYTATNSSGFSYVGSDGGLPVSVNEK